MSRVEHRRVGFRRAPRKGSKSRRLLMLALRPCGVLSTDARALFASKDVLGRTLATLYDECGYDIRSFPSRVATEGRGRPPVIYRLVGKLRWDGSYRSFIHREIIAEGMTRPHAAGPCGRVG